MGQNTQKVVADGFFGAVDIITDKKIANAGFDKTISAEIIEVIDASIGKYKVKYQDANFVAYSENTSATYKKGTMVQILLPKGDISSEYKQILGATARLGTIYLDEDSSDALYEKNGGGCIASEDTLIYFPVKALPKLEGKEWQDFNKILYKRGSENNFLTLINEDEINKYLKNSSAFLFSCKIKTELPTNQQRKGKYGIRFKFRMETDTEIEQDEDSNDIITIKEFEFNSNNVIGTPYNLISFTEQEKAFELDKGTFGYIEEISVFAKDFEVAKEDVPGYIGISDINIFGATALTAEQVSDGKVSIVTPKGRYFNQNLDEIEVEAKVYLKGKLANRDEQKYQVYWFKKNSRIHTGSEEYNRYGNLGWMCLNEKLEQEKEEDKWVDGVSILKLHKDNFKAKETVMKCVVVFEGRSFESEFVIYNSDADYEFKISSSQSVYFANDTGSTTLTLIVSKKKIGEQGKITYEEIKDGIDFIWNTTSLSNTVKEVGTGKTLEVQARDINTKSIYNCSVYDKESKELLGSASIEIFNEARAPEYTLVIVNGKQTFKYDVNGYSPTHAANEHPTPIKELSFEIYDKKGQKVRQEVINTIPKSNIHWLITNQNKETLLNLEPFKDMKVGEDKIEDPLKHHFEIKTHSLSFQIKDRYSYSANQNQIELKVEYIKESGDVVELSAITEFVFVKEGAQGTNGTEAVCWLSHIGKVDGNFIEVPYGFKNDYGDNIDGNSLTLDSSQDFDKLEAEKPNPVINFLTRVATKNYNCFNLTDNKPGFKKEIYKDNTFPFKREALMNMTNIIQGKGIIGGKECSNILPFVVTFYEPAYDESNKLIIKSDYRFKLKPYSGFLNVQYETNGKYPKYDNDTPFEIECYKKENEKIVAVSAKDFNFNWDCTPLLTKQDPDPLDHNKQRFAPKEHYDSYSYTQAVWVIISQKIEDGESGPPMAIVHIPIYFYLNKYSNAAINEWDGNGIEINKDKGIILSPQVGAGHKEEDNSFTGVVIGTKETHTTEEKSTNETGLFGYNKGQQTIFLDAKTGKSEFGASGKGQIIIDPSQNNAQIYSGDYYKRDADGNIIYEKDKNGKLIPVLNKTGMLIDLTEPSIRFGSGNFEVNKEGHITAQGGGTIAGWKINDDAIFSKDGENEIDEKTKKEIPGTEHKTASVGMSSAETGQVRSGNFAALNEKPLAFWAGKTNFMVAHDGTLKATSAAIGGGIQNKENDNIIYIGVAKDKDKKDVSAIYSGKTSFNSEASKKTKGFYLGADGFAIGRRLIGAEAANNDAHAFSVNADGHVMMTAGQIGYDDSENGTAFWTVDRNAIRHGAKKGYDTDEEGIYIGTDGIGLGKLEKTDEEEADKEQKSAFYVDADGNMHGGSVTVTGGSFSIGAKKEAVKDKDGKPIPRTASTVFHVDSEGNLVTHSVTAVGGQIGGWTIGATQLSAEGIIIDSKGSIKATAGKDGHSWEIDSDGNATFNWITADGGTIGGITISKDEKGNPTGLYAGDGGSVPKGKGFSIGKDGKITAGGAAIYGSCDWENGNYYLKMGLATNHPEVSGLNITGTGGIKMGDEKVSGATNGISYCNGISNTRGDMNITCDNNDLTLSGNTLYLKSTSGSASSILITTKTWGTISLENFVKHIIESNYKVDKLLSL